MRVLITGAYGQVGHELMRHVPEGFEVVGMGSGELNVADAKQVAEVVARLQPHLIINAAAYTAVDQAETDAERAFAVNRDGVAHLACAAEQLGIPILHISTDYVFAGDASEPYSERDPVGPTGVYGASKLAGEQALAANCSRYLVLRTSWVFGAYGNNFVKTMLRLGRERDQLSVVADQIGAPTSARSIAVALWRIAQTYRVQGELTSGVYHFSGAPACTWHEFAVGIFAQAVALGLLSRQPNVHAITSADYPTPARRPHWSVLCCVQLQAVYAIPQADWRDELVAVLTELR